LHRDRIIEGEEPEVLGVDESVARLAVIVPDGSEETAEREREREWEGETERESGKEGGREKEGQRFSILLDCTCNLAGAI
jgi:hypothetical protein